MIFQYENRRKLQTANDRFITLNFKLTKPFDQK